MPIRRFPVWKRIRIGGKSGGELLAEMRSARFQVDDRAREAITEGWFDMLPEPVEVALVRVTVDELFDQPSRESRINIRRVLGHALDLGLELCPAEVGPHLRLADPDQPREFPYLNEIGMEPIVLPEDRSDSFRLMFQVGHSDGERYLIADLVQPGRDRPAGFRRFVFVDPRQ